MVARRPSRARLRALATALALLASALRNAAAQPTDSAPAGGPRVTASRFRRASTASLPGGGDLEARASRRAPAWAPLASFAVPGAGQLALRQPRGAAYFGLEVYEWIQLLESRREAQRLRGDYRRLAREVARTFGGVRPDGPWSYYEDMEEYAESGRFDVGGSAGLVPEPDASTFNGAQWLKARTLYWVDPDVAPARTDPSYQRALDFYSRQAVRDEFAWTWKNQEISRAEYRNTIARYNGTTHDVRTTLGVILANHLVSSIDAFAAVRLRRARGPAGEQRIDVSIPLDVIGRRRRAHP